MTVVYLFQYSFLFFFFGIFEMLLLTFEAGSLLLEAEDENEANHVRQIKMRT